MGIRRRASVMLATVGTLAAGASVAAVAWGAQVAGPLPLHVETSEVECFNTATLASVLPKFIADEVNQIGPVPTVRLTFRSATGDARLIAYSVTVDGQQRASGAVSGGGVSMTSVTLDNHRSSRMVVTSDSTVMLDKTVVGHC